jgi:hypothetical protein
MTFFFRPRYRSDAAVEFRGERYKEPGCPMDVLGLAWLGLAGWLGLTRLEGQRHFCDAAGDVETPATFDAERLQRD